MNKGFCNISTYSQGDVIQAMLLLDAPYPTQEDLDLVKDRACYPTLYAAIDALTDCER